MGHARPPRRARRVTRAGPTFIAHGVTGVRDMASPLDEILTLRDRWRTASPSGPRLFAAGPILQGPLPFELPLIQSVDSPEAARTAVDDLHRAGVDFIKVGDTVPPDAYRAVVARARPSRCGPPSCRYERRRCGSRRATEYRAFRQRPLSRPAVGVVVRRRPAHAPRPGVAGRGAPG